MLEEGADLEKEKTGKGCEQWDLLGRVVCVCVRVLVLHGGRYKREGGLMVSATLGPLRVIIMF